MVNPTGIRHRAEGHYHLRAAYRRAAHLATLTGVRHRVEVCRVTPEGHFLPIAFPGLHYVVKPVGESDV